MGSFEDWWEKESGWGGELLAEGHLAKSAWNAAIDAAEAAVDDADYDDNVSGINANIEAMNAVRDLEAK